LKEKEGALISQIYEGSPAEKVDLKVGDIVLNIDGRRLKTARMSPRSVEKKGGAED